MTRSMINPFYAARVQRVVLPTWQHRLPPRFAKLPRAPINASPVPRLTSLYHLDEAGPYGNRSYPGNCGGELIKDLLTFYRARHVFDPMTGSGTCRDVCRELGVPVVSFDLKSGFDACDAQAFDPAWRFDFVWVHPPYWRQKVYSTSDRDLSTCITLDQFLTRYARLIANMANILAEGGNLAVLMGDYFDRCGSYIPLVYHTKRLAFAAGLRQQCTDIIRFSHGASSNRKIYRSSFIPGLHAVCMIFEKGE